MKAKLTLLLSFLIVAHAAIVGAGVHQPADMVLEAPINTWDEGIPLGNGLMGGLLWGKDTQINLSLDRGDLWDLQQQPITRTKEWNYATLKKYVAEKRQNDIVRVFDGNYNYDSYPTKIPAGRLVFNLPQDKAITRFRLNMAKAVGYAELKNDQVAVFYNAAEPVICLSLPLGSTFQFKAPESVKKLGYPPAKSGSDGNLTWSIQEAAEGMNIVTVAGTRQSSNRMEMAVTICTSSDSKDPLALATQRINEALSRGFDAMQKQHEAWWRQFWAQSSISIPHARIQSHYDLVRYFYGAASRKGAPPMPLQGVWTADSGGLPPWKGDYHHDLNTQTTYLAYGVAGHFAEGESFLDYNIHLLDRYRRFAREFMGLKEGAVVPGVADLAGNPLGGWPMYSMGPTHGAWIAQIFHRHWKLTADAQFLREKAWPFCSEIAAGLLAMLQEDKDGKLVLPLSSSPEIHDNSLRSWLKPNSNYDLAMLRFILLSCIEQAKALGLAKEKARFEQALARMQNWHLDEKKVLMFAQDEPFKESHRHHSHLIAFHPLGLFDPDREEDKATINATLDAVEQHGTRAWTGYSFSWFSCMAARAGRPEMALKHLQWYLQCTLRNGFHVNGDQLKSGITSFTYRPFTLEGNFLAMEAVHDMLLQSWPNRVEIFPAVPKEWEDVTFRDLRAEGSLKVSAVRKAGKTQTVHVESIQPVEFRLRDPFQGAGEWQPKPDTASGFLLWKLKPGDVIEGKRRN